jgi:hypothetical protein
MGPLALIGPAIANAGETGRALAAGAGEIVAVPHLKQVIEAAILGGQGLPAPLSAPAS